MSTLKCSDAVPFILLCQVSKGKKKTCAPATPARPLPPVPDMRFASRAALQNSNSEVQDSQLPDAQLQNSEQVDDSEQMTDSQQVDDSEQMTDSQQVDDSQQDDDSQQVRDSQKVSDCCYYRQLMLNESSWVRAMPRSAVKGNMLYNRLSITNITCCTE